jgi:hypothetical protein
MLHWQGCKCEGSRYFFYFSVICFSLTFWFKGSVFESDIGQTILFAKAHILDAHLIHKARQLLRKYKLVSPWKGCFQDLASLTRCPESLSFNHGSHSSRHELNYRSNITLRRTNFAANRPYTNFIVDFICYFWFVIWDGHQSAYGWFM